MKQEILCSLLGAAMVLPTAALAQEAAKPSRNTAADLEEVVITGSLIKREESSLLVTTLSSDEITERAATNAQDILTAIAQNQVLSTSSDGVREGALINLANIHYTHHEMVEAQSLYERAIALESDFFEAYFNLGNIHHDQSEFDAARRCYDDALLLNPYYADTHFYMAVTLEKMGLSHEARPHWRSYQQLAPQGEWVELAREFSEGS